MVFYFDLVNDFLVPPGYTNEDVSETSTVWDSGLLLLSNIGVQMQNQHGFSLFPRQSRQSLQPLSSQTSMETSGFW